MLRTVPTIAFAAAVALTLGSAPVRADYYGEPYGYSPYGYYPTNGHCPSYGCHPSYQYDPGYGYDPSYGYQPGYAYPSYGYQPAYAYPSYGYSPYGAYPSNGYDDGHGAYPNDGYNDYPSYGYNAYPSNDYHSNTGPPRPNVNLMGYDYYTASQMEALKQWYRNNTSPAEAERWSRFWEEQNRYNEEAANRRIDLTFGPLGGE